MSHHQKAGQTFVTQFKREQAGAAIGVWTLAVITTVLVTGCCCTKPSEFKPPAVVLDAHAHLFNARYLPLKGIMVERGAPSLVAEGLEVLILAIAGDSQLGEQGRDLHRVRGLDGKWLRRLAKMPEKRARAEIVQHLFASQLSAEIIQNLVNQGKLKPEQVEAIKAFVRGEAAMANPAIAAAPLTGEEVARAIENTHFLADQGGCPGKPQDLSLGVLQLVAVACLPEREVFQGLRRTFTPVDLFVHHMMDLERTYNETPNFAFDLQVKKMLALQNENPGLMLTFGAFDPFRREQALAAATNAYAQGVIGFKFYPPDGYRPTNNTNPPPDMPGTIPDQYDSRYSGASGGMFDGINEGFFAFCEDHDIPIFVHCTPGGFEAVPCYGDLMADPIYWAPVFEKHKKLRVCFGHSGGDALWFGQSSDRESLRFGETVAQICSTNDNAYCDAGYWEAVLTDGGIDTLRTRLPQLLARYPKLAKKLVYGSDWFMVSQEENYGNYLNSMMRAVLNPKGPLPVAWNQFVSDFFAGNEARFLKLDTLVNDPRVNKRVRGKLARLLRALPNPDN